MRCLTQKNIFLKFRDNMFLFISNSLKIFELTFKILKYYTNSICGTFRYLILASVKYIKNSLSHR